MIIRGTIMNVEVSFLAIMCLHRRNNLPQKIRKKCDKDKSLGISNKGVCGTLAHFGGEAGSYWTSKVLPESGESKAKDNMQLYLT